MCVCVRSFVRASVKMYSSLNYSLYIMSFSLMSFPNDISCAEVVNTRCFLPHRGSWGEPECPLGLGGTFLSVASAIISVPFNLD